MLEQHYAKSENRLNVFGINVSLKWRCIVANEPGLYIPMKPTFFSTKKSVNQEPYSPADGGISPVKGPKSGASNNIAPSPRQRLMNFFNINKAGSSDRKETGQFAFKNENKARTIQANAAANSRKILVSSEHYTPIDQGFSRTAKLIEDRKIQIQKSKNGVPNFGKPPSEEAVSNRFFAAIESGDIEKISHLVECGLKPYKVNKDGDSPVSFIVDNLHTGQIERASAIKFYNALCKSKNASAPEGYVKPYARHGTHYIDAIIKDGGLKGVSSPGNHGSSSTLR